MLKSLALSAAFMLPIAGAAWAEPRNLTFAAGEDQNRLCTDDGAYCAALPNAKTFEISHQGQSLTIPNLPLAEGETSDLSWNLIELSPGHVLAGVVIQKVENIQDGRFQRRDLLMWDINLADGSVIGPILDFPVHAIINTEGDCRGWPDSAERPCAAEYEFNSRIDLIRAESEGYPVLTFRSAAVVTPHGASREFGWDPNATMLSSDGQGLDPLCTFKRSFSFNPLSGRYVMDAPMPDCGTYLEANLMPRRAGAGIGEIWLRPATPQEIRNYISPETQVRMTQELANPKVEIGWIYNELFSGYDLIALRVSDGGRCIDGNCDLHIFATSNCVEPALCTPRWVESRKGNRLYAVTAPEAPLDLSCPDSLLLLPVGRDQGQYCIQSDGLSRVADMPADLTHRFPKE